MADISRRQKQSAQAIVNVFETGRVLGDYGSVTVLAGDSGDLAELRPGTKTQTGRLDGGSIEVEEDGSFEILLAPERPDGHSGNFISTLAVVSRPHPTDPL